MGLGSTSCAPAKDAAPSESGTAPSTTSALTTRLRDNGFAVGKISPLMPYTQQRTVILYRDGYRNQAIELSRSFAVPPAIVNNTHTRPASDTSNVRLVLGKASVKAVVVTRLNDKVATR